jgi:Holliday junction DNA helicase RuvB
VANRLLRRVHDFATVHTLEQVSRDVAADALALFEIDPMGLDRVDRQLLEVLAGKFKGKPVGLSNLAVAIGEEPDTIESVIEPYLIRIGFLQRTPRGREITGLGAKHIGMAHPEQPTLL